MKFTDEHHALYKTVKEFGEKEIKPFNEEFVFSIFFQFHLIHPLN